MACLFLSNCNKKRYDSLLWDIENDYTRGNDTYPNTLTDAYDYLVNYIPPSSRSCRHPDKNGISFYQDTPPLNDSSGRGGQGRGRSTG